MVLFYSDNFSFAKELNKAFNARNKLRLKE